MRIFKVEICYVLQEQRVLYRCFWPKSALYGGFRLSALIYFRVGDDGFVVALNDGRHDSDDAVQLWAGHVDTIEYTAATRRLVDYWRQSGPLHQVLVRQLVEVPGQHDVCCRKFTVQLFHACF